MSSASDAEQLAPGESQVAGERADRTVIRSHGRAWVLSVTLAIFVLGSAVLGLWAGRGHALDADMRSLFLQMRAYRVGVAFLAGGALAVGGTIVQGLFRNPLASPQILGTSAGALLGGKAAMVITFLLYAGRGPISLSPEMMVPLGCVIGAVLSLVTLLSFTSLRASAVTLILTGFALNGLFSSFGSFLTSLAQESFELQRAMSAFAAGSLSGVGPRQLWLAAILVLAGTLPALLHARELDVLLSGEEEAASLGVDVTRVRFWCVAWASLVTAGAVAVGGGVGFVGLVIPHALRRFTGPAHRHLIPAAFFAGGGFLILCDALCRALPVRHEIPLDVLTDLIGVPAFLYILHRVNQESPHA